MLKFFIDARAMSESFNEFKENVKLELENGVKSLSAMTHAKVAELASSKLKTTREKYLKALDYQQVGPGIWVVSLDESALWIEDGKPEGSMVDDLLSNKAKTAKDGSRYRVIPFDQAKDPSKQSPFEKEMTATIKDVLKKEGQSLKKIEYNADGSPRLGRVGRYDIESPLPTARANTPALFGLHIYQTQNARGKIRRDVMTFRVVSSKHKAEGKWYHPGLDAKNFMDQALTWAEQEWEHNILPSILEKFNK